MKNIMIAIFVSAAVALIMNLGMRALGVDAKYASPLAVAIACITGSILGQKLPSKNH